MKIDTQMNDFRVEFSVEILSDHRKAEILVSLLDIQASDQLKFDKWKIIIQ